jgi:hypothetical protein
MPEISSSSWSEVDSSNNASPPNGWPEGQAASTINNCARADRGAIRRFWGRINPVYASTGTAGAYILAHAVALSTYSGNEIHSFRAHTASAAAPTVAIDGLAALAMKKYTSSGKADLAAGDIQSDQPVMGYHDGTHFVVVSPLSPAGEATPNTPTFITLSTSSTLANERVFNTAFPATYSDAGAGGILLVSVNTASQALMEAAASQAAAVTPGVQQYHPSACKGWAKSNFGTAPTANYNCTALTDLGAGQVEYNWDTDFSSANYVAVATGVFDPTGASSGTLTTMIRSTGLAAGTTRVDTVILSSFASADVSFLMCAAFGDQS